MELIRLTLIVDEMKVMQEAKCVRSGGARVTDR